MLNIYELHEQYFEYMIINDLEPASSAARKIASKPRGKGKQAVAEPRSFSQEASRNKKKPFV
jgi:hypothetical protein